MPAGAIHEPRVGRTNQFTNGVAPTPQSQVTFSARDLRTGRLSIQKSLTLSQSAPTSVTFSAADHEFMAQALRLAEKSLCTDNAAIIAILAERKLLHGQEVTNLDEEISPNWALT